jgi:hypothetical protein
MRKFLVLGLSFAGIAAIVAVLLLAQGSPGLANPYPSSTPANATRALNRTYRTTAWTTPYVTQPQPTPGNTPSALRPPQGKLAGPRRVVARNLSPAPRVESRNGQPRLIPRLAPKLKRDPRAQPPRANALDRPSTATSPSRSAPDIVSGFEGLDSTDNPFGLSPPDPQVAVGPNHVVEFVNVTGRIYTKAGVPVSTFSLDDFFRVFSGAFSSDPRVIYDDVHHRFFASFVDLDYGANFGDLFLAISQTDDPTGAWNQYVASFPGAVPDYPGIGVTDDKFTLSYNLFGLSSFAFIGEQTLVVQKSDVMAGDISPGAFFFPINANRFTVRPAQSLSATNDQYLTTFDVLSNGGLLPFTEMTVIRITGTPDGGDVTEASATDLPVLTQDTPPASVTAGSFGSIDSGDFRMLAAVWRDNSLWSSASAACVPPGDGATRSCAHLIEVATVGAPSVVQDIMFGAVNQYYSWPAISTDSSANLYVSFTGAHSGMFASAQVAGRLSTDPVGAINGSCLLKAGEVVHFSGRWGDYLGAAVDPADPSTVWVVGEYAKNDSFVDWGTHIGSLSYTTGGTCPQAPVPPTPSPTPTPAPAKGNDNFAAALVIPEPLPFTNAQNTAGSTTEPGEPSPCGNIASTDWYSFTPSGNQTVVANTFGSNYDTVLAVYTGPSLGALTLVGCNDQFGGNQSQVQFSAVAGTTYHIQAGGFFGQTGTLVLNLTPPPPPPANDNFADAIAIPEPLPYTNTQTTAGGTTEAGEPSPCGGIAATVWYRFTPSSNQTLVADTFGSNYSTELAVYTGPDLSNLTLVACNYSRVRFTAAAGITYYFQAGGFFGQTGNLVLNLTNGPIPLPTPSPTPTPTPLPCPGGGNDGFEVGTVSTNLIPCWTVVDQAGGFGSWCIQTGTSVPQGTCAGSSTSVAAPPAGLQAAMTNQSGPGSHVLYRCDTLSTGSVSFELYLKNENGAFYSPPTLDYTFSPNQQFRADLVTPSGIAANPFTVAPGDILANLYQTLPGNPAVSGYATKTGMTGLIGQTVCLRFAVVDNQYYFHAGVDNVQFNAPPPPTPTPTNTPPPTVTGTPPTATPTNTPTPTPAGLDFSIGTNLLSSGGACDSSGTPTNVCNVSVGDAFTIDFKLNSLPPALAYDGYDATIQYSGLDLVPNSLVQQGPGVWPACAIALSDFSVPGQAYFLCAFGQNAAPSTYTGTMAHLDFRCPDTPGTGALTLVHGATYTDVVDDSFQAHFEAADESLTIHCVAPQAYPGDTDGDGCPDANEQQTAIGSERTGGRRNYLNPWDYFNPTHDGKNRVDDILAVVRQFGKNDTDANPGLPPYTAGYTPDTDRTSIPGGYPWSLSAPNGTQTVADILAEIYQYGHDCS